MEDKYFIVWVAGFWEGEGSISRRKNKQNCSISIAQNTINKYTIRELNPQWGILANI